MKRIPKLSVSTLFVLATTLVILSINITPLITHIRHAPADRQFTFVHNNIQDFYFYQALMNRGAAGDFLTRDPFTTEAHQPSIIFSYFVWLGKLSHILGIPYFLSYHILRFAAGAAMFLLAFKLIRFLEIPHPRLAFFFFVFAAPLLRYDGPYMYWWTGMDPIRRAAYLPHHMVGGVLLLTTIILFIRYMHASSSKLKVQSSKLLITAILIAPIMAFIHTPSLFILLLIVPPTVIIFIFRNLLNKNLNLIKNLILEIKNYIGLLGYWIIGLLSLLVMVSQTNRGFPWSQYVEWERNLQFPLAQEYPGALGVLLPFAAIGVLVSLFSKKFERILLACWFVVPMLFIPLAPNLGISNIRLIQGVPYLPLAILAVMGISTVRVFVIQTVKIIQLRFKVKFSITLASLLFYCCIVTLFIITTLPAIVWSVKDQIREYWTVYSNVYLDKRLFEAFSFINITFAKDTITLSTFYTGNYLPVFTHTRSFIGHTGYTANRTVKESQVVKFFKQEMSEQEAKTFLSDNKITLVFQGPDEKSLSTGILYPTILTPAFQRESVTIYQVK